MLEDLIQTADLIVATDGSGYKDGYGGFAVYAWTPDKNLKAFRMGSLSGSTVDRAEFTACLDGLQLAWEMWQTMPEQEMHERRPEILWLSDRESLILSAKKVQARSNCPDLWERYDWYETRMLIRPTFVNEDLEQLEEFRAVDLHSSVGRGMIKAYLDSLKSELPDGFLGY